MAKNGRFQYQRRTAEDVKARANYRGGAYDSFVKPQYKFYKIKDGKNIIRFLPPTWPKANHFGYTVWINYGVGPENNSYLSLSKMKGEKDPLQEAATLARREGDEKLARALDPRERVLVWVIDRQAPDDGPQLWPMPLSVDKAVATLSYDEDTKEVSEIDSPTEGRDFRFYKEGQGLKTKYLAEKMKLLSESALHEDEAQAEQWLQFVQDNPVPDCLQFYDYDHISSTFDGQARVEDEDENPKRATKPPQAVDRDESEEDEPARPAASPAREGNGTSARKARVVVPEPEINEEEDPPPQKASSTTGLSIRERLAQRQKELAKRQQAEEED